MLSLSLLVRVIPMAAEPIDLFGDDGADLFRRAQEELFALNARVVRAEVRRLVAEEVKRRDLIPRPAEWQPSGTEVMHAMLAAIRAGARTGAGTYVGAHKLALDACRDLEVPGSELVATWRRSRSQVDEFPNPSRPREGSGRPRTPTTDHGLSSPADRVAEGVAKLRGLLR